MAVTVIFYPGEIGSITPLLMLDPLEIQFVLKTARPENPDVARVRGHIPTRRFK